MSFYVLSAERANSEIGLLIGTPTIAPAPGFLHLLIG